MSKQLLIGASVWAVTGLAAFFIGRSTASAPDAPTPAQENSTIADQDSEASASETKSDATALLAEAKVDLVEDASNSRDSAALDALRALAGAPSDPDLWRKARIAALMASPEQAGQMLDMLNDLPPSLERDRIMLDLVKTWATEFPAAAIDYAEALPSLQLRSRALNEAMEGWASTNPTAASEWLLASAESYNRRDLNRMFESLIEGYASTDLSGAFQYMANLNDPNIQESMKRDAAQELVRALMQQGFSAEALNYITLLPEGSMRSTALVEWASELGRMGTEDALRYFEINAEQYLTEAGDVYDDMQSAFVRSWSDADPAAAAAWLDANAASTMSYTDLVASVARDWARHDLTAAADWINGMEPTPELDRAVGVITFNMAREDPATAMRWAESISNDRMRNFMTRQVANEWKRSDPEAFESYLEQSSYTEEEKQAFRDAPERGGFFRGGSRSGRGRN